MNYKMEALKIIQITKIQNASTGNKSFWTIRYFGRTKWKKVNLSTLIQPCEVVSTCAKSSSVDGHLVINVVHVNYYFDHQRS